MAKPLKIRLTIAALLILVLVAGVFVGIQYYQSLHITIHGNTYERSITQLDLKGIENPELNLICQLNSLESLDIRDTGITVQDHDTLQAALPECEILWSVPFQGGWLDSNVREITIETLSEEDVALLDYLPELETVNAGTCRDYAQLVLLQERRPECQINWQVFLQDEGYDLGTRELTFADISADELAAALPYLTCLETVTLTQVQTDVSGLLELMSQYPDVTFIWDTELLGVSVNSLAAEIDFSGILIEDLESLEAIITRLPKLETVTMCGCGISNEEMEALNLRHENIKFIWEVTIRNVTLRTDITYFMPYQYRLKLTDEDAYNLRYFTDLVCLDLGHYSITNCDFVACMPHLKYLLLADTRITDLSPLEGLEELVYLEIFMTDVTDYTPLLTLPNLECLNLCYTAGQVEVIAQLTWVDYIRWIAFTKDVSAEEREYLKECLPDTLLELGGGGSSTGGNWRTQQHYYDMRDLLGMSYMTG